jgi:hypothetical protein
LDLSFNNFRADASRKLGDWLKQNMSLFGLHFAGNGKESYAYLELSFSDI